MYNFVTRHRNFHSEHHHLQRQEPKVHPFMTPEALPKASGPLLPRREEPISSGLVSYFLSGRGASFQISWSQM